MKQTKITLQENEIPERWYNVVADMPNKPLPPLNPATQEPQSSAAAKLLGHTPQFEPDHWLRQVQPHPVFRLPVTAVAWLLQSREAVQVR